MRAKFPIFVLGFTIFLLLISMILMSISSAYTRSSKCFDTNKELKKAHNWSMWYAVILAFALVITISITYIYIKWSSGGINWYENTTSLTIIIIFSILLLFLLLAIIISSSINSIYIDHSKCKDENVKEAYKWSNICWIVNLIIFILLGAFVSIYTWKKYQETIKSETKGEERGEEPQREDLERRIKHRNEEEEKRRKERALRVEVLLKVEEEERKRRKEEEMRERMQKRMQENVPITIEIKPKEEEEEEEMAGEEEEELRKIERMKPGVLGFPGLQESETSRLLAEMHELRMESMGGGRESEGETTLPSRSGFAYNKRGTHAKGAERMLTLAKQKREYPEYVPKGYQEIMTKYPYLTQEEQNKLTDIYEIHPDLRSPGEKEKLELLINKERYFKVKYPGLTRDLREELKTLRSKSFHLRTITENKRIEELERMNAQDEQIIGAFFEGSKGTARQTKRFRRSRPTWQGRHVGPPR